MWGDLAPARRRLYVGLLALVVLVAAAVVVAVLLRGGDDVEPVAQDQPGPVLLVPGYGGSTASLQVLADALTQDGKDARVVKPRGDGTQDLRDQAADLGDAVDAALADTGAPSVDLVGYSAGGVVVRYYVAELGGGSHVRRAVTLASPHHGTDLASLAGSLGSSACPEACQQLDPDSDLLRGLNAGDETPPGPAWVALWTEDDATVVPPDSGSLEGALDVDLQDACPGTTASHPDVPRTPAVIALVEAALATGAPTVPGDC
ncbi:alpha/beta fold hydrolase [Nocardioides anomalus]|uniref:Alpha/beta fold hydrolase n=1 Tax=Nocardioides anomalus TaxID=2712223 RepID=A0A6G6WC90_9ACTN|nr:alpha/beta fold hydrolase [Nocardioides anomalus]QIG42826.1 alpha/beta fold hydrolase [Nocardioides anomalus]